MKSGFYLCAFAPSSPPPGAPFCRECRVPQALLPFPEVFLPGLAPATFLGSGTLSLQVSHRGQTKTPGMLSSPTHPSLPTGVEGFTSQEDQEMLSRIEKQLKRRFAIGSQVSEHSIIQDFTKQVGPLGAERRVLPGPRVGLPGACFPPTRHPCLAAQLTGLGWGWGGSSSSWTCPCHSSPRDCRSPGQGQFSVP